MSWMKRRLKKAIVEHGSRNTSYIDALRISEDGKIVLVVAHGNLTDVKKKRVHVHEEENVPDATIKRLARDRSRIVPF